MESWKGDTPSVLQRRGSAPCCTSSWDVYKSPRYTLKCNGVHPLTLIAHTEAQLSTSNFTAEYWPENTAACSGAHPWSSVALTSPPCFIRAFIHLTHPLNEASWRREDEFWRRELGSTTFRFTIVFKVLQSSSRMQRTGSLNKSSALSSTDEDARNETFFLWCGTPVEWVRSLGDRGSVPGTPSVLKLRSFVMRCFARTNFGDDLREVERGSYQYSPEHAPVKKYLHISLLWNGKNPCLVVQSDPGLNFQFNFPFE